MSGLGVHIAARIGALAEEDEILASHATAVAAEKVNGISAPRSVTLKGVAEPVEVVGVEWR